MHELERAQAVFRAALEPPLRQDARLLDDLVVEAGPVLEGVLFALRQGGDDPTRIEHREGLALAGLLGRRVAVQRVSPSAFLVVADALVAAAESVFGQRAPHIARSVRAVMLEGFCAALEERLVDDAAARASARITPARIAPRCWAIVIGGEPHAESLRTALDACARVLLDADALSCLVHLAISAEPTEDIASEVFAFAATARMIGVQAVFSGVDADFRAAAESRNALTGLAIHESLGDGLAHVLDLAGADVRARSVIAERVRGFFARRAPG